MRNKRLAFSMLKTLSKSRYWVNKRKNQLFFQTNFISTRRRSKFYFGRFKRVFKFFRLSEFSRPSVDARFKIKITSLVRLLRTNKFARKFWWKVAQKFKRFSSVRQPVRVFRSNLFWRFPFYRRKVEWLRSLKSSKNFNFKRKRMRYFFSPKSLFKRIRSFYFLNRSKWRTSKDLSVLHVRFTLNNLFITLSTSSGKNLVTISSGALGFKGTTKLTTYAIEKVGLFLVKFMRKRRYRNLYIVFNSGAIGYRSKLFIETLIYNSLIVRYLTVSDSIPHNGVRPRKTKRR